MSNEFSNNTVVNERNSTKKPFVFGHLNTAEVLDKTFFLYKKNFVKHLLLTAVLHIVSLVFSSTNAGFILLNSNNADIGSVTSGVLNIFGTIMVGLVISAILSAFISAVNVLIIKHSFFDKKVSYRTIFKELLGSAPVIISYLLAYNLVVIPIIFVFILIFYFVIGGTALLSIVSTVALGRGIPFLTLGIGTTILIIVVIIVFVFIILALVTLFSLSLPAAVIEKKYFFSSISRSIQLVTAKKSFWKIFGVMLLWGIITTLFSYGITTIVSLIIQIPEAASGLFTYSAAYFGIQTIITSLASVLILPLNSILDTVIFNNQRIKKDGLDIERAIEILNNPMEDSNSQS